MLYTAAGCDEGCWGGRSLGGRKEGRDITKLCGRHLLCETTRPKSLPNVGSKAWAIQPAAKTAPAKKVMWNVEIAIADGSRSGVDLHVQALMLTISS
jgi:hypothetical protein